MRKLIFNVDDEYYEVPNVKEFEKALADDDLKTLYFDLFCEREMQRILDDMVSKGMLQKEGDTDEEIQLDLEYTFDYIDNLLFHRLGIVEYKTYTRWCMTEFDRRLADNQCKEN